MPRATAARDATVIVLAAFALRVWGIDFGLPHTLTRPDEEATLATALRFFGRHFDPGFYHWPSLFMYGATAGFLVYFNIGRLRGWFPRESTFLASAANDPAPLLLLTRLISALAGTVTVWLVHRIGLRLFDRTTASVAALFLAVAVLPVRDSHFGVPDTAATALAMASFLWTCRYTRSGATRDLMWSAAFAGLATSAKYNLALVAAPAMIAVVLNRTHTGTWRHQLGLVARFAALALAAFCAGTPYVLVEPSAFAGGLREIAAHLEEGHLLRDGPAWGTHLLSTFPYGLGWPMFLFALGGIVLHLRRAPRDAAITISFPAVYFLIVGSGDTAFARYMLPVFPLLALCAAYAVVEAARRLADALLPQQRTAMVWTSAVVVALPALAADVQVNHLLTQTDSRLLAVEPIAHALPCGGTIYQSGFPYGHVQLAPDDPRRPFRALAFDPERRAFGRGDDATTLPDLIVVQRSPLAYSAIPPELTPILSEHYDEVGRIDAIDLSGPPPVYDAEDAFFVPLARFASVTRPGPNLHLYLRSPLTPGKCASSP